MEHQQKARQYHQIKLYLFFFSLFLDLIFLSIFMISGWTFDLAAFAGDLADSVLMANALYIIFLAIGMYLLHFPLNIYSGYFLEHKFSLSNQAFSSWMKDDIKKALIGLVLLVFLVEVLYILLAKFPRNWWLAAGGFWFLFSFVMAKITPDYIVPLFYKYIPIDNINLKQRILSLFESCGVALKDVYAINMSSKTKKANAFLCGIGKNRRVVLSDTLISEFTQEEVEVVVAHELGHYQHKDIFKLLFINAFLILIGFYLVNQLLLIVLGQFEGARMDEIAFFPLIGLGLMGFSFILSPLINAYSRRIERQADLFSMEQTKQPDIFISLMEKLGKINLAEFNPGRLEEIFFYDHPPIGKRIKFAEGLINKIK